MLLDAGLEGGVNLAFSLITEVQPRYSVMGPPAFSRADTERYSIPIWKRP